MAHNEGKSDKRRRISFSLFGCIINGFVYVAVAKNFSLHCVRFDSITQERKKGKLGKEIYWSPRAAYEASEIKESFDEIPRRAFSIEVTLRTRRRARWKEKERFTPFVAIDTFVQQMRRWHTQRSQSEGGWWRIDNIPAESGRRFPTVCVE